MGPFRTGAEYLVQGLSPGPQCPVRVPKADFPPADKLAVLTHWAGCPAVVLARFAGLVASHDRESLVER